MRLNQYDSALIYTHLSGLESHQRLDTIRSLSQRDRKIVQLAINNISQKPATGPDLSDLNVSPIIHRLTSRACSTGRPNFIVRFVRMILRLIHWRLSAKQVITAWDRVHTRQEQLKSLAGKRASKIEQLAGIKALIEFKHGKARQEYVSLKELYEVLPDDFTQAQTTLDQLIEAHLSLIDMRKEQFHAGIEGVDIDLLYVLEKQILPSLQRLKAAVRDDFKIKLAAEIQACKTAIEQCDNPVFEKGVISKLQSEIQQLEDQIPAAEKQLETLKNFDTVNTTYRHLLLELSSLKNPLLQHNVLSFLETQIGSKKPLELEAPLAKLKVEGQPENSMYTWEGEVREARTRLWDDYEGKKRFETRDFAEGTSRTRFIAEAYAVELGLKFCTPYEGVPEVHYTKALRELAGQLNPTLLHRLEAYGFRANDAFVDLIPEQPRHFDLRSAAISLKEKLQVVRDQALKDDVLAAFQKAMTAAHELKIQEEYKDKFAFNLLGLGKKTEETRLIPGLSVRLWVPEIENLEALTDRGIISLTHLKVLCRMFTFAMEQLQAQLPRIHMRSEGELIAEGIYDRETLCLFLRDHKDDLSSELLELFGAVLGEEI